MGTPLSPTSVQPSPNLGVDVPVCVAGYPPDSLLKLHADQPQTLACRSLTCMKKSEELREWSVQVFKRDMKTLLRPSQHSHDIYVLSTPREWPSFSTSLTEFGRARFVFCPGHSDGSWGGGLPAYFPRGSPSELAWVLGSDKHFCLWMSSLTIFANVVLRSRILCQEGQPLTNTNSCTTTVFPRFCQGL